MRENTTINTVTNKILIFLYNWGLFILSILIIVTYLILSANPQENSLWSNILFSTINLLATFYVAQKIALWGWKTDNAINQKKIAKSAIRQNRTTLTSIIKLIKITHEKIDLVEDLLIAQYLKEIKNHLEMIFNASKNSEASFNDIVNEELIEQNILEVEISEIFELIEQKNLKLQELEGEQQADKITILTLKKEIKENQNKLSTKISDLPFGLTSSSLLDNSSDSKLYKYNNILLTSNYDRELVFGTLNNIKEK